MVIASIAVAMDGLRLGAQSVEPKPLDDPEAYAVYAALVPGEWAIRNAKAKRLVLQKETRVRPGCAPAGPALETDWKPVVDNFWTENAGPHSVREGFSLGIPYLVLPADEINSFFTSIGDLGWDRFYQRYPDSGGFTIVSAVGFDAEKRRAMVYLSSHYGSLGAEMRFHFLEKIENLWLRTTIPGVSACIVKS